MRWWRGYRYKHLSGMMVSFGVAYWLSFSAVFEGFLLSLGAWGIVGAFVGGVLFVNSLTVGFGAVMLLRLTQSMSPLQIALIAGYGAVIADFLIFRFVKNSLLGELRLLYHAVHGPRWHARLKSRYLRWTLPLLGTIIIASPFPDEVGIGLLGLSDIRSYQMILITFVLNVAGIYLVLRAF